VLRKTDGAARARPAAIIGLAQEPCRARRDVWWRSSLVCSGLAAGPRPKLAARPGTHPPRWQRSALVRVPDAMAELDDLIDGNATDDQSHRPTGTLSGPSARVCAELPTQTGHTIDRLAAGLSSSGAKAKRRAAV